VISSIKFLAAVRSVYLFEFSSAKNYCFALINITKNRVTLPKNVDDNDIVSLRVS